MNKIRIVHHSNQLGLGGTEKTMQLFCKYLDKDCFEVHALTRKFPVPPQRMWLDALKSFLGNEGAKARMACYPMIHCRVPEFKKILGEDRIHFYTLGNLASIIQKISPHILHLHHSGFSEPPLDQTRAIENIPLLFSTNVFGEKADAAHQARIAKVLFISGWLKESAGWSRGDPRCDVLYYPIEKPCTRENLRKELGIGEDVFVFGRIGRNADDIHDPISLKAYKQIESDRTLFLALSPPPQMIKDAQDLGVRHIRTLDPTVDDQFLSRFYNTIDILAHARLDGETFGCVIGEAMIHGKPVITHRSNLRNAQVELVDGASGFVVDQYDWNGYAAKMKLLMEDENLRLAMGEAARRRAMELFEAEAVTKKLENFYWQELKKKGLD